MVYNTYIQSKFAHTSGEPLPEFYSETPLHVAFVHYPIAFNTLAWSLDILYGLTKVWIRPSLLTSRFSGESTLLVICRLGYFLLWAGLLSSVPAIVTGNFQLAGMIRRNGGLWERDDSGKQTACVLPRIKVAISHALFNDLVFVVGLYSWYQRRSTETRPNVGNTPSSLNIGISMVLLPVLLAGAKAGRNLVFNHGVGLKLGRKRFE